MIRGYEAPAALIWVEAPRLRWRLRELKQAAASGLRDCLSAALYPELAKDRGDVVLDGARRDEETLRDRCVPEAVREESQYVGLARRQRGCVRTGGVARPSDDPADAKLP